MRFLVLKAPLVLGVELARNLVLVGKLFDLKRDFSHEMVQI